MCGTRFSNIHELPALWVITSNRACGSTPSRSPKAIASAAAAMCTPASSWLTIFTFEPRPWALPKRYTLPAMPASTSSIFA